MLAAFIHDHLRICHFHFLWRTVPLANKTPGISWRSSLPQGGCNVKDFKCWSGRSWLGNSGQRCQGNVTEMVFEAAPTVSLKASDTGFPCRHKEKMEAKRADRRCPKHIHQRASLQWPETSRCPKIPGGIQIHSRQSLVMRLSYLSWPPIKALATPQRTAPKAISYKGHKIS